MNRFENRKTILIVEDEVSLRNALRDKFMREGYVVFDAKDGEQGLAMALLEYPNLILLDIVMPKMDGMTMLKKLRSEKVKASKQVVEDWAKSVPVMILTNLGADDKNMTKDIVEDDYTHYFVKSNSTLNDLVEKVKERLSKD